MLGEHLRAAWRSLRRRPGLSLVMVLVLGTGAGLFTVALVGLDAETRLTDLNYAGISRVLLERPRLRSETHRPWLFDHIGEALLDRAETEEVRASQARVVATYQTRLPVRVGDRSLGMRRVRVTTAPLFDLFRRRFLAGAPWAESSDDVASERTVVVSDATAKNGFGRTDVVGQRLEVDGVEFTVVGVTAAESSQPYDLRFNREMDELFIPWAQGRALDLTADFQLPGAGFINVFAAGDTTRIFAQLVQYEEFCKRAQLRDSGMFLTSVLALLALSGCILNFARLLLAKFISQPGPSSIRRALGAGKWDLFELHFIEALLLAVPATLVALAIAAAGARAFDTLLLLKPAPYVLSWRSVLGGVGVTWLAAMLGGLLPALHASRVPPAPQLRYT
jgi:putative ABC transport system permease protein